MIRRALVAVLLRLAVALAPSGTVRVRDGAHGLWYKTVSPPSGAPLAAPLVVLHGGPGVPSDYLFPLAELNQSRAVVFYDQLGCGRSDAPGRDEAEYSPRAFAEDLGALLRALGLTRFHLYGQSWGGLLAFEYLASPLAAGAECLSLTLSNCPTSVSLAVSEAGRLADACNGVEDFNARHVCRLAAYPRALDDAYAHAGTVWRGTAAVLDHAAPPEAIARVRVPSLVVRGEHDFVTAACVRGWEALPRARARTLDDASHHALLEKPDEYLAMLGQFLGECDEHEY